MEDKVYNPVTIANYFIAQSKNGLTLMQLLKLSYIAHGFKLAILDHPLANEYAEAWKYGPVFPSIYHEFKAEIDMITEPAQTFNMKTESLEVWTADFTENEKDIMDIVVKIYGPLEGWKLSALTHAEGTPWAIAWEKAKKENGKHIRGFSIRNEDIKKHYLGLIEKMKNAK